jgi:hypothetical protein
MIVPVAREISALQQSLALLEARTNLAEHQVVSAEIISALPKMGRSTQRLGR